VGEPLINPGLKIYIDLGEVNETARVTLNGKEAGTVWKAPYKTEVTGFVRQGENDLVIEVANTWANKIIGDLNSEGGKAYTWSNSQSHYSRHSELVKSGLMGPVKLNFSLIKDIE